MLTINGYDESYVRLEFTEQSEERFIKDKFTFIMKGWEHTPSGRAGLWDGKLSYYNLRNKLFQKGLVNELIRICQKNNIKVEISNLDLPKTKVTLEKIRTFVEKLNIHSGGQKITMHDYQENAIVESINAERILIKAGTSSGKSLIIYVLMMYYHVMEKTQIIVVPSTSLVEQMYTDFQDYSTHCEKVNIEKMCSKLYSGQKIDLNASILITTWQSLQRKPKDFFNIFEVFYGDEAHSFKAKELNDILLNKCNHIKYRIGTTGTTSNDIVDKGQEEYNEMALKNLFGDIYVAVTTKELADRGISAKATINCIQLNYSRDLKYLHKKNNWVMNYKKEMKWLCLNHERRAFIASLPQYFKGNTLMLFNFREDFGLPVFNLLNKQYPDKHIFYLDGESKVAERERVRSFTENNEDVIILASYGIYQQGVNVKNIHNVVLAVPYKSATRILQSIGRGLRKNDTKSTVNIVDISDDLQMPRERINITKQHANIRYQMYQQEQFSCRFVKKDIK